MEENEEFDVLELDTGDGWTRVRRRLSTPNSIDKGVSKLF